MTASDGTPSHSGDAEQQLLSGSEDRAVYRSLLRGRGFNRLFLSMFGSSLGDWIGVLAILALAEKILGPGTRAAAFGLSGVMVARVVPVLLLGPVAGVYADRWDRKRTMIATDIGRGTIMALIPFVGDFFQLFVATFLVEVLALLFTPAKDATIPNLVPRRHLVQANQLSLMVTYGTLPIAGLLFALLTGFANHFLSGIELIAARPESVAIWFNALTFLVSAPLIAGVAIPGNGRRNGATDLEQAGAWDELKQGVRFIVSQPLVRALVIGITGAFLAAGIVLAVGKLFASIVNAGESGFGVLVAAAGTGLFLGLMGAGQASRRVAKERLFAPGVAIGGAALVATAFMPRLDLAVIPAVVMGLGGGIAFVTGYTILHERTEDAIRARTFAAFHTAVRAALFVSLVIAPVLAGVIGPERRPPGALIYPYQIGGVRLTMVLGGIVAMIGAVWTGTQVRRALSRSLRLGDSVVSEPGERHGFFVAFEGGEGAGKSTQIRLLRAALEREGYDVLVTREPGGTGLGEHLRDLLLDPARGGVSDHAEALLYAAARAQHAQEVIAPALEKGHVVLSDRYVDSSIVYQGAVRGLGETEIEELNRWATADLQPDLVVVLDIDAEEGLGRVTGTPDRLEAEGLAFHRLVNEAFRRRAARSTRYLVVSASRPVEQLHAEIRGVVLNRLATRVTRNHEAGTAAGVDDQPSRERDEGGDAARD